MALPATDTFASATPPVSLTAYSANWTMATGLMQIVLISLGGNDINVVQPNSSGADSMAYWNADAPNADQYSQGKIVPEENASVLSGVAVRVSTSAHTGYALMIHSYVPGTSTVTYSLFRFVAGTGTELATGTTTFVDDDTLGLEVSGTGATVALVMKRNGTQFGSTVNDTDASRITAAGRLGQAGYNITGGGLRNWEGGNLAAGGVTLTVDTAGAITIAGQSIAASLSSVVTPGAITLAGQSVTLARDVQLIAGAITLSGQDHWFEYAVPWEPGVITIAGQSVAANLSEAVTAGAITVTGQDVALSQTGTTVLPVTAGAITLAGQPLSLQISAPFTAGALSLAGSEIAVAHGALVTPGAITINGQAVTLTDSGAIPPVPSSAQTITVHGPGSVTIHA